MSRVRSGRHRRATPQEGRPRAGGADPFIVLSYDDLDTTVRAAAAARLQNAGQACNAAKRFIVADHLYDEFVARFTDHIRTEPAAPLSSLAAAERLELQVAAAVEEGASLATSGRRDGAIYPPGVLTGVHRTHRTYREELFGPVATVFRARDEHDAIDIANDSPYGLGSYVFTTDPTQADRVADALDTGMVFVNCVQSEAVELPFGGVKRSGFGRELGRLGIHGFINHKVVRAAAQS